MTLRKLNRSGHARWRQVDDPCLAAPNRAAAAAQHGARFAFRRRVTSIDRVGDDPNHLGSS